MGIHRHKRTPFHRQPAFPVLWLQLSVLLLAAFVFSFTDSWLAGYSALIGGAIAWLPNIYFAYKAFRFSGARAAQAIVRSFYAGEAGKLILTSALFALTFIGVKPLNVMALFAGFVLTLMVSWFAPIVMKNRFLRP